MSGRPSMLNGRAHRRAGPIGASAMAGTKRLPRRIREGTVASTSGSSARNVEPSELVPSAVTRLNAWPASSSSSVPGSIDISASSRTCVGGDASDSETTTPQRRTIGRHMPLVSTIAGDHGPAATRTSPAAIRSPSTTTPADAPVRPRDRRGSTDADLDAGSCCPRGVRPGGARWTDRIADVEAARRDVRRERRLERCHLVRRDEARAQVWVRRRDLVGELPDALDVAGDRSGDRSARRASRSLRGRDRGRSSRDGGRRGRGRTGAGRPPSSVPRHPRRSRSARRA